LTIGLSAGPRVVSLALRDLTTVVLVRSHVYY
jgi:hypothetical protein